MRFVRLFLPLIVLTTLAAAVVLVAATFASASPENDLSGEQEVSPPRFCGQCLLTRTPTPTPSPTPLVICSPNPDPASPAALQVETPEAEEKTTIPVRVRGWSTNIGEEGKVVFVAIVAQNQMVLQMNEVPPQPREFRVPPPGLGITEFTRPFAIDILLDDVDQKTPYCIWVYQDVDGEGMARGVVQVPIIIEPR